MSASRRLGTYGGHGPAAAAVLTRGPGKGPARRLRRGFAAMCAALAVPALALAAMIALPVAAQAGVLVSNVGQVTALGGFTRIESNRRAAQGFRTGSATEGYRLSSIELAFFGSAVSSNFLTVSLRGKASGGSYPTETDLVVFQNPSLSSSGTKTWTLPTGTASYALSANTSYYVVVTYGAGVSSFSWRFAGTETDSGAAPGWSIQAGSLGVDDVSTAWRSFTSNLHRFAIRVNTDVPQFESANVDEDSLVITFDEELDDDETPARRAFNVQVEGSRVTVDDVDVSGSTVTLELASAVSTGDEVTVAYTKPSGDKLQNDEGLEVASFSARSVMNNTDSNVSATGRPTISGTARVSETLTASTSGIADRNGVEDATFTYRWIRVNNVGETDIPGATSRTYRTIPADRGTKLKVKVRFTDDGGYSEGPLKSAAYPSQGTIASETVEPATCEGDREIWSSTLKAETWVNSDGDLLAIGFIFGRNAGTLGENSFDPDDTVTQDLVQILGLSVSYRHDSLGTLFFTSNQDVRTDLSSYTLCVGDASFDFATAERAGSLGTSFADSWADAGLDWEPGDRMTAKIVYIDTTEPTLQRASVDEATLTLTYDEDLDPTSIPAPSAFTVDVNGDPAELASTGAVAVSGRSVILTLAEPVITVDRLTVSYTAPSNNPIQDEALASNDAASLDDEPVRNETPQVFFPATCAGTAVWSATMTVGTRSVLNFRYAGFDTNPSVGSLSDRDFRHLGTDYQVNWLLAIAQETNPDDEKPSIAFSPNGEDVFNSNYRLCIGSVEFNFGAAEFTSSNSFEWTPLDLDWARGHQIGVKIVLPDTTPPTFRSATVRGDTLTMVFNEELDEDETPSASAFNVRVGGARRTVADVYVRHETVRLELVPAVEVEDTVTVAYTKPTSGDALQDPSGNEVATFAAQSVRNATGTRGPVSQGFPPSPVTLIALANTPRVIDLSWNPPDDTSGITGYWIEVSENGGRTWSDLVLETRGTPSPIDRTTLWYRHTPVPAGETRTYRVSSLNAKGASEPFPPRPELGPGATTTAIGAPVSPCTRPASAWCAQASFTRTTDRYNDIATAKPDPVAFRFKGTPYESHQIHINLNSGRVSFMFRSSRRTNNLDQATLYIGGRAFRGSDASFDIATLDHAHGGHMFWDVHDIEYVRSAKIELVDSRGDRIAPKADRAVAFARGSEVVLELSEALGGSAGALSSSEVARFKLVRTEDGTETSFASGTLTTAQDAEDAFENPNVLRALDREELRVIRLSLDGADPIERDEFVRLTYDEGGLEDPSGNVLEGFTHPVINFSDWAGGADGALMSDTSMTLDSPTITGAQVGSPPGGNGWDPGERVVLKLTFSRPVEVDTTDGTPAVPFLLGVAQATAAYESGSGTATLVFSYTLPDDAPTANSVTVAGNALTTNGGTIRSAQGQDASLEHDGVGHFVAVLPPPAGLTAAVEGDIAPHDGSEFSFVLAFSEPPEPLGHATLRRAFTATGGTVKGASRVEREGEDRNKRWTIRVKPDGNADVTLVLGTGPACGETGAICTEDDHQLAEPLTITVPGPEEPAGDPLTARFHEPPDEHGGNAFDIAVKFSEPIINSYQVMDAAAWMVGGAVTSVKRHNGQKDHWIFRVQPRESNAAVAFTLRTGGTCAGKRSRVICTSDGKVLSESATARIYHGPAAISVADARAEEGEDDSIDFRVTLDRPATRTVTVDYETRDGSGAHGAVAGEDYTAVDDTLTFEVGELQKTVEVRLLDDPHDEGEETFTLVLSNAVGGRIEDGTATGTIENDDPLPQAWIARFGRTVAEQVLDAVEGRMRAPRAAGAEVSLGGRRIGLGPVFGADGESADRAAEAEERAARREEAEAAREARRLAEWLKGETDPDHRHGDAARAVTARELMLGSSFALTAGAGDGPGGTVSLWGRGAASRFDGREGGVSVDGEVTSALLGAGPGDGGADRRAQPGRRRLPRAGRRRRGDVDADRALPVGAVCALGAALGVGRPGLWRGGADADAGGAFGDARGPRPGAGGARRARGGGRGAGDGRSGACGQGRCDGCAHRVGEGCGHERGGGGCEPAASRA